MPKKTKSYKEEEMRWETEEDLRALARVKSIENDPERMKRVKKLAKEKLDESKQKKAEAQEMIKLAGK